MPIRPLTPPPTLPPQPGEPVCCIIIGAGIAGLITAHRLQKENHSVIVLEKELFIGGRIQRRAIGDAMFDAGAQFLTVRDHRFAQFVNAWIASGILAEWSRGFPRESGAIAGDGPPRYKGAPSMSTLADDLARGLDIRLGVRALRIVARGQLWEVQTSDKVTLRSRSLVLTPPPPQSLALLESGNVRLQEMQRGELEEISYEPCLGLLAVLEKPSKIPAPGGLRLSGEPLSWIADNQKKGVSPRAPCLTIHAGPQFSRAQWDRANEDIARLLLGAAAPWIDNGGGAKGDQGAEGEERGVRSYEVLRWRYAQPVRAYPEPCLPAALEIPAVFAGDAFGGPRLEGAALSGLAAAAWLIGRYSPCPYTDIM